MSMTATCTVTVGVLLRRPVRTMLMASGLEWQESKGFLESDFVIRGNADAVTSVMRKIQEAFPYYEEEGK